MRPHVHAPNGLFADDLLLYGSLERGAVAARGYSIELPELRGASHERRNAFREKIRAVLALVTPSRSLQCQWHLDWDHSPELLPYLDATVAVPHIAVRRARNERVVRYGERMQRRQLRRERLAIFLAIEIDDYSGNFGTRKSLQARHVGRLAQLKAQFADFETALRVAFGADTAVRAMDDAAHHASLFAFLNPGSGLPGAGATGPAVDPQLTLQENCWHSDGIGQPDGGFVLDGFHHGVLVLNRWPKATYPGIVGHLTSVGFLDYRITVNVTPSDTRHEVTREEHAMERLQGEYAEKRRHSLLVALQKKERKVESLAGG